MNWILEALDRLATWTYEAQWRTWLAHTIIAAAITGLGALTHVPVYAATFALGAYLFREGEQILWDLGRVQPIDWRDHLLDMAGPVLVFGTTLLVFV